jgi:hypothetical protein
VGAAFHTMKIESGAGRWAVQWVERLRGLAGAIADLVIGRGDD